MPTSAPTERVADYPRPPRLERSDRRSASCSAARPSPRPRAAWRVLETFHPPSWYLPPGAFRPGVLRPAPGRQLLRVEGPGALLDAGGRRRVGGGGRLVLPRADPGLRPSATTSRSMPGGWTPASSDEERVVPQPGGFYGGWITAELVGPFKGGPGTLGW